MKVVLIKKVLIKNVLIKKVLIKKVLIKKVLIRKVLIKVVLINILVQNIILTVLIKKVLINIILIKKVYIKLLKINGFDKYGKHKDTNTFLDKEKNIRKDILRNIKWLEDRDTFLELYDKIIENGEIIVNIENDTISSDMLKDFLEDILSGNIKYKDLKYYEEDINNIEKKLNNSIKNKKK